MLTDKGLHCLDGARQCRGKKNDVSGKNDEPFFLFLQKLSILHFISTPRGEASALCHPG